MALRRVETGVLSTATLVTRYAVFAVVATVANLGTQRGVLAVAEGTLGYVLALCAGTGVGLVLKYLLDKRWIFADTFRSARAETRMFSLYTLTGVGTTLLFWGMETAFWLIWQTQGMRELGAVIGLTVGYVTKYQLDKRYVFSRPSGPT